MGVQGAQLHSEQAWSCAYGLMGSIGTRPTRGSIARPCVCLTKRAAWRITLHVRASTKCAARHTLRAVCGTSKSHCMTAQACKNSHAIHTALAPAGICVCRPQVMGDRKPNCVIIDEIDGATGGSEGHSAIAALLKLINAGSKTTGVCRGATWVGWCSWSG